MINYGRQRGKTNPPEIEMTATSVFIASNVSPYTKIYDGRTEEGYEYDYVEYTKDEYIAELAQELKAAKILLGVD